MARTGVVGGSRRPSRFSRTCKRGGEGRRKERAPGVARRVAHLFLEKPQLVLLGVRRCGPARRKSAGKGKKRREEGEERWLIMPGAGRCSRVLARTSRQRKKEGWGGKKRGEKIGVVDEEVVAYYLDPVRGEPRVSAVHPSLLPREMGHREEKKKIREKNTPDDLASPSKVGLAGGGGTRPLRRGQTSRGGEKGGRGDQVEGVLSCGEVWVSNPPSSPRGKGKRGGGEGKKKRGAGAQRLALFWKPIFRVS